MAQEKLHRKAQEMALRCPLDALEKGLHVCRSEELYLSVCALAGQHLPFATRQSI